MHKKSATKRRWKSAPTSCCVFFANAFLTASSCYKLGAVNGFLSPSPPISNRSRKQWLNPPRPEFVGGRPGRTRHLPMKLIVRSAATVDNSIGSSSPKSIGHHSYIATIVKKVCFPTTTAVASYALIQLLVKLFWRSGAINRMASSVRFYATIPVLAGLFNALTNRLAVWMMFQPIKFKGINVGSKSIGWQGIVPRNVQRMAGDISDMLTQDLIDVSEVLRRVDPDHFADLILTDDDRLLQMCQTVLSDSLSPNMNNNVKDAVVKAILTRDLLARVIARTVRSVQGNTGACIDLRHAIVEAMAKDPTLIVDLFQSCGRDELQFMVVSGGYGGALLGLFQMCAYASYPRAWTLVLGGMLVGYVTDTLALKIMFAPIEPKKVLGLSIQGLFLKRQNEVSDEFASFVSSKVLPPSALWEALLTGPRRGGFVQTLTDAFVAEVPKSFLEVLSLRKTVEGQLENVVNLGVTELAKDQSLTEPTHAYVTEQLELKETIRESMTSLPSAKFERVLHPVFEQDEAILIAVGSILGGLVGLAQVLVG